MTREEAVNRFKGIRESFSISIAQSKFYPSKVMLNELCDMAIEALSANYTTEKPKDVVEQKNDVVAEPTDLISRADAIEAVANAIWHYPNECYRNLNDFDMAEALAKDALSALPSAEAVKVAYICDGRKCDADCSDCFRTLDIEHAKDFKLMGGVYYQQESADRPSGEWIIRDDMPKLDNTYSIECSKCGQLMFGHYNADNPNYCPNCGAKMGGNK